MSNSQEIAVTVLLETYDGKANEQIQAFHALVDMVLAEKGCLQYELTQSTTDENKFVLLERWASEADLEAHLQTPHMKEAGEQAKNFRSKPAEIMISKTV